MSVILYTQKPDYNFTAFARSVLKDLWPWDYLIIRGQEVG